MGRTPPPHPPTKTRLHAAHTHNQHRTDAIPPPPPLSGPGTIGHPAPPGLSTRLPHLAWPSIFFQPPCRIHRTGVATPCQAGRAQPVVCAEVSIGIVRGFPPSMCHWRRFPLTGAQRSGQRACWSGGNVACGTLLYPRWVGRPARVGRPAGLHHRHDARDADREVLPVAPGRPAGDQWSMHPLLYLPSYPCTPFPCRARRPDLEQFLTLSIVQHSLAALAPVLG